MTNLVYLNGEYLPQAEAKISIFDRGFLFGDSVYEVIPFYNGVGFRLEEHLARLRRGLEAVRIRAEEDWEQICQTLVTRNGGGHQAVYLQVTRGADTHRVHAYRPDLKPTVLLFSYPICMALSGDPETIEGIRAVTTEDIRWQRCDIKATTLLGNIMALQQATDTGADEALMVRDGFLTEGSACNLFVIEQGRIATPARDHRILGGTTRDLLLELAAENGIPWTEEPIAEARLARADEVWISSSTKGVLPVLTINGCAVGSGDKGPLWYRMAGLFKAFEKTVFGLEPNA
ncbi:D-amino acid aminotransferase [Motiliproteus sp. SC1-56]|uniref:D-amino acid aminotransferase n=1 Tax=Motiliproteus sp. SC1-56 TaxID=2799565 RepID=UPI001A8DACFD|nr:D-amino acid aminotransferase [Motiliproteus sp. SC1-56]